MNHKMLIIVSFMMSASVLAASETPIPSPDKIAAGEKLYATNCSTCHGAKGQGDGPAAMAFNPKPRNLQTEPFKAGTDADKVFATISKGLTGSNMPGFSQLNENDRWNLVFFIKSIRKN